MQLYLQNYLNCSINQFQGFVTKKFWLHQSRIGLSFYDGAGLGYLKKYYLESYIFELISTLQKLKVIKNLFYSFNVCIAVRKLFLLLDPLKTGKVKIKNISKQLLGPVNWASWWKLSKEHLAKVYLVNLHSPFEGWFTLFTHHSRFNKGKSPYKNNNNFIKDSPLKSVNMFTL